MITFVRTPAVAIRRSLIGGKQDGPLFGILSVASTVNTDLKWRLSACLYFLFGVSNNVNIL